MLVGRAGFCDCVCFVVAFVVNVLAEFFIVYFVAVFAFYGSACSFGKFELHLALLFDGVVRGLEGCEKVGFGNFVHFAFHHHDVIVSGADHELHVGTLELFEIGVDYEFAVDTGHTHFADGTVEWYVADSNRS